MLVPAALVVLSACGDSERIVFPEVGVVAQVIVTPAEAELLMEQKLQLQVRPEDEHGYWVEKAECTWSTADPMVVGVGPRGLARGISRGSATVIATCDSVQGSAVLTVDPMILEMSGNGGAVLFGVGGSSATDVFAVGTTEMWACCGTIMHYDGMSWSTTSAPRVSWTLLGVWASSADDVFAVGPNGTILHYDGAVWVAMESGTTALLGGIWGSSATDVFAVGQGETVLHYDGQSWSPMSTPSGSVSLTSIWGSPDAEVFAVGENGVILHHDGASWVQMPSGTTASLNAVWGSSANDVFVAGDGGAVLHYDGASWKRLSVPTTHDLIGIWGTADNHVFVVGASDWIFFGGTAVVLHYDGVRWGVVERKIPAGLFGVWGTSEDLFLVGHGPTVIRVKR